MSSIRVPEPVMSLALIPKASDNMAAFTRALARFQKEDPTFKASPQHCLTYTHRSTPTTRRQCPVWPRAQLESPLSLRDAHSWC